MNSVSGMLLASGLIASMPMPVSMTRSRADQRPVAGEREAVAGGDPQQRHERGRGEALRHGGQKILLAHHAGVEQRQPRNGHHQDEIAAPSAALVRAEISRRSFSASRGG